MSQFNSKATFDLRSLVYGGQHMRVRCVAICLIALSVVLSVRE